MQLKIEGQITRVNGNMVEIKGDKNTLTVSLRSSASWKEGDQIIVVGSGDPEFPFTVLNMNADSQPIADKAS